MRDDVGQICPRCGSSVPASEMAEHIRIELLDPKWREQKAAFEAKKQLTNYVDDSTLAENLTKLTEFRTDIFGSKDISLTSQIEHDTQQKKQTLNTKVIWDGQKTTAAATTTKMNRVAQQEALLAQKQMQSESDSLREAKRIKLDPGSVPLFNSDTGANQAAVKRNIEYPNCQI